MKEVNVRPACMNALLRFASAIGAIHAGRDGRHRVFNHR
ncbi:hypothetical protein W911_03485 [Hyphomicrobium nitrativorans NL23]|uniref:Uncharacterized protein n=1 Tax=Hyphomicrobium nitrativorans NL23 TaxID=1029756 RepID=V5SG97_9HYPH|nr:hypothetical protein W911_03485 [Hyphomicrobium nitrativorans NL23]